MISIWDGGGLGYAATADLSDAGLAAAVERARHWAGDHRRNDGDDQPTRPITPPASTAPRSRSTGRPCRSATVSNCCTNSRGCSASTIGSSTGTPRSSSVTSTYVAGHPRRRRGPDRAAFPLRLSRAFKAWSPTRASTPRPARSAARVLPAGRTGGARPFGFRDAAGSPMRRSSCSTPPTARPARWTAARPRPDDPADPRVHRPSAGTRPHPGRRAQLRRHQLCHARHVRHVPVRLGPAEHHVRSHRPASWRPTASTTTARPPKSTSSRTASSCAAWAACAATQRSARRGQHPGRNWNRPPIDRMANLNLEPGDSDPRRDDRVGRARRVHEDQQLVVDRRQPQQVPVRLRVGPAYRGRQADDVVRNPNYRGISATFWRNLRGSATLTA